MGRYWDLLVDFDKNINPPIPLSIAILHIATLKSDLTIFSLQITAKSCLLGRCEVSTYRTGTLNYILHEKCMVTVCQGAEWDDASY